MYEPKLTGEGLPTYTIYYNTKDYPQVFVCRRQMNGVGILPNGSEGPLVIHDADLYFEPKQTLDECRNALRGLHPDLRYLGRQPQDDPVIVEVWI
jgi:hypothetical protein